MRGVMIQEHAYRRGYIGRHLRQGASSGVTSLNLATTIANRASSKVDGCCRSCLTQFPSEHGHQLFGMLLDEAVFVSFSTTS